MRIIDKNDWDGLRQGETLQRLLDRNERIPLGQKVRILYRAGEDLADAHEKGIVHGDVKLSNILVLPGEVEVEVLYFGAAGYDAERNIIRGTLRYMAPEVLTRNEFSRLSDIFAFGVVCYEFLTGRTAFRGSVFDLREVFHNILWTETVPMLQIIPECPQSLDRVIARAMAKNTEVRYQGMRHFLLDLSTAMREM